VCHNHSHITTDLTGVLLLGGQLYHQVKVIHQLAVLLPYGEKWIRPSGSILLVPALTCEPWPALQPLLTEVYYIPSSFTAHSATITTPLMPLERRSAGEPGRMSYIDSVQSALQETTYDE